MEPLRILRALCVGLSSVGLILPGSSLEAVSVPAAATASPVFAPPVQLFGDVELDPLGSMQGVVVDARGVPVGDQTVMLRQSGRELARAESDAQGRFRFGPLRGGTYQLWLGKQARSVRAWAANTAPPAARNVAMVVVGGEVVRGQLPLEEFFASDSVLLVGLVAAVIAIPIAVHNSRPRSP